METGDEPDVVDTARGRGSAMRLTGGPWDGREVDVGMGVRVLVVPFIPTDGQRDDVRRGAWIGIDVGLGEVRYVDGVYEGSFVRVDCCYDHSAHWTRRGTLRKRQPNPLGSIAVVTGIEGANNPLISTYDFMRDVVGYDLAAFFKRNSKTLRSEIDTVLTALLAPETK